MLSSPTGTLALVLTAAALAAPNRRRILHVQVRFGPSHSSSPSLLQLSALGWVLQQHTVLLQLVSAMIEAVFPRRAALTLT